MRVERRDGKLNRSVLTALIVSRPVLGAVAAKWGKTGLFPSRAENLIAGWAVNYYRKYGKAPGPHIEQLFDRWVESNGHAPEEVHAVESFLSSLSGEYAAQKKKVNPAYMIDRAADLFNAAAAARLRDEIDAGLRAGDGEKAWAAVEKARKVELGTGSGASFFADVDEAVAAVQSTGENVLKFDQPALDAFFANALEYGAFVSFMGKAKIGKSFWLQEFAVQAVFNGLNAAFFEVGDQTKYQLYRRLASRFVGHPYRYDKIHPSYRMPTDLDPEGGFPARVDYDEIPVAAALSDDQVCKALAKAGREYGRDALKVSVHPNRSISVAGIDQILAGWERDGWTPAVVVVDYPDILAPLNGTAETRDQINATWAGLRSLSQKWNVLLVTATQSDAASYDAKLLKRTNFADCRNKFDHVTGMVGINQTDEEKDAGVYRLNWLAGRDLEFSETKCVHTAACLSVCNPCVLSRMG